MTLACRQAMNLAWCRAGKDFDIWIFHSSFIIHNSYFITHHSSFLFS